MTNVRLCGFIKTISGENQRIRPTGTHIRANLAVLCGGPQSPEDTYFIILMFFPWHVVRTLTEHHSASVPARASFQHMYVPLGCHISVINFILGGLRG